MDAGQVKLGGLLVGLTGPTDEITHDNPVSGIQEPQINLPNEQIDHQLCLFYRAIAVIDSGSSASLKCHVKTLKKAGKIRDDMDNRYRLTAYHEEQFRSILTALKGILEMSGANVFNQKEEAVIHFIKHYKYVDLDGDQNSMFSLAHKDGFSSRCWSRDNSHLDGNLKGLEGFLGNVVKLAHYLDTHHRLTLDGQMEHWFQDLCGKQPLTDFVPLDVQAAAVSTRMSGKDTKNFPLIPPSDWSDPWAGIKVQTRHRSWLTQVLGFCEDQLRDLGELNESLSRAEDLEVAATAHHQLENINSILGKTLCQIYDVSTLLYFIGNGEIQPHTVTSHVTTMDWVIEALKLIKDLTGKSLDPKTLDIVTTSVT